MQTVPWSSRRALPFVKCCLNEVAFGWPLKLGKWRQHHAVVGKSGPWLQGRRDYRDRWQKSDRSNVVGSSDARLRSLDSVQ